MWDLKNDGVDPYYWFLYFLFILLKLNSCICQYCHERAENATKNYTLNLQNHFCLCKISSRSIFLRNLFTTALVKFIVHPLIQMRFCNNLSWCYSVILAASPSPFYPKACKSFYSHFWSCITHVRKRCSPTPRANQSLIILIPMHESDTNVARSHLFLAFHGYCIICIGRLPMLAICHVESVTTL